MVRQVGTREDVPSGTGVAPSPVLALHKWSVPTLEEKYRQKLKAACPALRSLEQTTAVNNGRSGFYFPVWGFLKSQPRSFQVSVSFLCLQNEKSHLGN